MSLTVLAAAGLAVGLGTTSFAGAPGAIDLSGSEIWLDGCSVMLAGETDKVSLDTGLPAPCDFVFNSDESLRLFEDGGKKILLVYSSREEGAGHCDTRLRAVLVQNGTLSMSERTMEISSCNVTDMDEKTYRILAHRALPARK
ncbi:hypothetical protein SIAM614_08589 [Stappia aggregata IAM 12614]|uniref:Uncharacterized protein n=2 Tax=Roseibium aggregatum TaxID=187304 RepID=A0P281_ROSAI|nr:hypothetical protein SIAM614_08589 [Stappia aggregata IAM 12614] [Roseibium aggregatum IAM 12614]